MKEKRPNIITQEIKEIVDSCGVRTQSKIHQILSKLEVGHDGISRYVISPFYGHVYSKEVSGKIKELKEYIQNNQPQDKAKD